MPPSLLIETLNRLWNQLSKSDLQPILAGGLALSYWGNPRSTQVIELAIAASDDSDFAKHFLAFGLQRKSDPKSLGLCRLSQWTFDIPNSFVELEIDVLMSDSDYYVEVNRFAVQATLDGVSIPVATMSVEDLIIHKVYAERLIDQADVVMMLQLHAQRLDFARIERWVRFFGIQSTWQDCRRRAV